MRELVLAAFFMAFGLAMAAALTHLVAALTGKPLDLDMRNDTALVCAGKVVLVALCGPYLLLQVGWAADRDGTLTVGPALLTALVAFGWAFISGLLLLATLINLGL